MEFLLDEERYKLYTRTIAKMIKKDDVVLHCNSNLSILAATSVKNGAKSVIAIEPNKVLNKLAKNTNELYNINGIQADPASYTDYVDMIVLENIDTLLLESNTAKIINVLISKGVIRSSTKLIPLKVTNFFEVVQFNFEFNGINAPVIVKAMDANERRMKTFCCTETINQFYLDEKIKPLVNFEGKVVSYTKGYCNAVKFSTVVNFTETTMLGNTKTFCNPIFVPIPEQYVNSGQLLNVSISYIMRQGLLSL